MHTRHDCDDLDRLPVGQLRAGDEHATHAHIDGGALHANPCDLHYDREMNREPRSRSFGVAQLGKFVARARRISDDSRITRPKGSKQFSGASLSLDLVGYRARICGQSDPISLGAGAGRYCTLSSTSVLRTLGNVSPTPVVSGAKHVALRKRSRATRDSKPTPIDVRPQVVEKVRPSARSEQVGCSDAGA